MTTELRNWLHAGVHRIGELEILSNAEGGGFCLCHWKDARTAREPGAGNLQPHQGLAAAREISNHAADGGYRFAKGQVNLKRGWILKMADEEELRLAIDLFYPAAIGLFRAMRAGTLEVELLRDKLNRQTGMYRNARNISDAGAQQLVTEICGPAHQCAKRILWKIDAQTPLKPSEASEFNGIPTPVDESQAIPLLCREACNYFVGQCRKRAKEEFDQRG